MNAKMGTKLMQEMITKATHRCSLCPASPRWCSMHHLAATGALLDAPRSLAKGLRAAKETAALWQPGLWDRTTQSVDLRDLGRDQNVSRMGYGGTKSREGKKDRLRAGNPKGMV